MDSALSHLDSTLSRHLVENSLLDSEIKIAARPVAGGVQSLSALLQQKLISVDDKRIQAKAWQGAEHIWSHSLDFMMSESKHHGIAVLSGAQNIRDLMAGTKGLGDISVSAEGEYLSGVGYLFRGKPRAVFKQDIFSFIDAESRQHVAVDFLDDLVGSPQELMHAHDTPSEELPFTEAILRLSNADGDKVALEGAWYKRSAAERSLPIAAYLARDAGVSLYIVDQSDPFSGGQRTSVDVGSLAKHTRRLFRDPQEALDEAQFDVTYATFLDAYQPHDDAKDISVFEAGARQAAQIADRYTTSITSDLSPGSYKVVFDETAYFDDGPIQFREFEDNKYQLVIQPIAALHAQIRKSSEEGELEAHSYVRSMLREIIIGVERVRQIQAGIVGAEPGVGHEDYLGSEAGRVATMYAEQLTQEIFDLEAAIGALHGSEAMQSLSEKLQPGMAQYLVPSKKLMPKLAGWIQKLFGDKKTQVGEVPSSPDVVKKSWSTSPYKLRHLYRSFKSARASRDALSPDDVRTMPLTELLGTTLRLGPKEILKTTFPAIWGDETHQYAEGRQPFMRMPTKTPRSPGEKHAALIKEAARTVVQEAMPGIMDDLGLQGAVDIGVVGTPVSRRTLGAISKTATDYRTSHERLQYFKEQAVMLRALGVSFPDNYNRIELYPLNMILYGSRWPEASLESVLYDTLAHELMHRWQDESPIGYESELSYWQRSSERVAKYFGGRYAAWALDEQRHGRLFDAIPLSRQANTYLLTEAAQRNRAILSDTFGWAKADVSEPVKAMFGADFAPGHRLLDEMQELASGLIGAYRADIAETLGLDTDTEITFLFEGHAGNEGTMVRPSAGGSGYTVSMDLVRIMHDAAGRDDLPLAWREDLPSVFGAQVVQDVATAMHIMKHGIGSAMPTALDDGTERPSAAAQWGAEFVVHRLEGAGYQRWVPSEAAKQRPKLLHKIRALFERGRHKDIALRAANSVTSDILEPSPPSYSPLISDSARSTVVRAISDTGEQLAEFAIDDAGQAASVIEQIADRPMLAQAVGAMTAQLDKIVEKPPVLRDRSKLTSRMVGADIASTLASYALGKLQGQIVGSLLGTLTDAASPDNAQFIEEDGIILRACTPGVRVGLRNEGWQRRRHSALMEKMRQQTYDQSIGTIAVQETGVDTNITININGNPDHIAVHQLDSMIAKTLE